MIASAPPIPDSLKAAADTAVVLPDRMGVYVCVGETEACPGCHQARSFFVVLCSPDPWWGCWECWEARRRAA